MKRKIVLPIMALVFLFCAEALAQKFVPRYKPGPGVKKGYIISSSGEKIACEYGFFGPTSAITKVVVKDKDGNKTKYSAKDVKEMYVETSALDNFGIGTRKEVSKEKYFIWRRVINKKGVPKLLQLVNPGYESKMQVYIDPAGAKGGGMSVGSISLSSEGEKSYYYTKGSSGGTVVKKGSYHKSFPVIFDDCKKMQQQAGKPKWKDFSAHVGKYEACE